MEKKAPLSLKHEGSFENGVVKSDWTVIEKSGSDKLITISGSGNFETAEHGKAKYVFFYELK
ncbi:MAG: DUF3224 domain-containing protein [Spirochaetota bacterium]|nr:DUF3224 domain-containing protein [Spirochaetota bacterium]